MLRMDDYNRSAKAYWWITTILGAAVLAFAVRSIAALPASSIAPGRLGVVIAGVTGAFPYPFPAEGRRSPARRSSSSSSC